MNRERKLLNMAISIVRKAIKVFKKEPEYGLSNSLGLCAFIATEVCKRTKKSNPHKIEIHQIIRIISNNEWSTSCYGTPFGGRSQAEIYRLYSTQRDAYKFKRAQWCEERLKLLLKVREVRKHD
jgi:hypothetical protein